MENYNTEIALSGTSVRSQVDVELQKAFLSVPELRYLRLISTLVFHLSLDGHLTNISHTSAQFLAFSADGISTSGCMT